MSGLTEAAAANTAAEQLEIYSVMHDLGRRYDRRKRKMYGIHVRDNSLCHSLGCGGVNVKMIYGVILIENGRVKRRNENTAYLRGLLKKSLL